MISTTAWRPLASCLGTKALRDERLEVQRQVHQELRATLFGEEVDHAVERLVGAVGVNRCHAQVAPFRRRRWSAPSSRGSRISPIRITSGAWRSVFFSADSQLSVSSPHLALRHHAVLVRVHEFHRVLDRDDVALAVLVAPVDHGGKRGRLARAVAPTRITRARAWTSQLP